MSNNIDIKTLEAFQDGNHKAFETVFIAYYNKTDRKSTRLNSSHSQQSRMPSSA